MYQPIATWQNLSTLLGNHRVIFFLEGEGTYHVRRHEVEQKIDPMLSFYDSFHAVVEDGALRKARPQRRPQARSRSRPQPQARTRYRHKHKHIQKAM